MNPLSEKDYLALERCFISRDLADRARLRRVDSEGGGRLVGRNGHEDYSGIVFSYYLPGETHPREHRLRRDHPDIEQSNGTLKEKAKYLSPPGGGNRFYFPPGVKPEWLRDTSIPAAFVEGEKKTLALSRVGLGGDIPVFIPIGLAGVWGWRGRVGKGPDAKGRRTDYKGAIPDFNLIEWRGRTVYLIFDTNVHTNEKVRGARSALKRELEKREAKVLIVDLPEIEEVNGPDDLLALKGPDFLLDLIRGATDELQQPEQLPDDLLPVPRLTPELLPESLRGWLVDVADRMQCPIEFSSVAALIALASVVGNKVRIRPKRADDWTVVPNLWGAIVAPPGFLKTPAREEALRPLRMLERIARDRHAEDSKDFEFRQMCAEAERKQLEADIRSAIKGGDDPAGLKDRLQGITADQPVEHRYIVNDPTVEKLGELLNQNPTGLLLDRDELVGWLRSLEKDGHENDRTFFLETWAGSGSYIYDRIARGTIRIDNLTVSILGGIQPGPLRQYLHAALREGSGDDGLMQRFQLLVYPDPPAGWQNVDRPPDMRAAAAAERCFQSLDALPIPESPFSLRFDPKAQQFFDEWRKDLETTLRDGSLEHAALEGHLAKYRSLMPSLALLFQLADDPKATSVSLGSTRMAGAWCSLLEQHARRIYGMALTAEIRQAKAILRKIQSGQLEGRFTARDVYRKHWAGLSTPAEVNEPLRILVDHNYLRVVPVDTGGREMKIYLAHPSILGDQQ